MPILIPYGDPQTHGTLGKAITFRRWRGKVVAEKKPRVRQPNTAAQISHRELFKEAWKEWFKLNLWELQYLQLKAAQKGMITSNLWIQMYLKQIVWSKTPNNIVKSITDMNLPVPISDQDQGIHFTYFGTTDTAPPPKDMGSIWDAENEFDPGFTMAPYEYSFLEIESPIVDPFKLPFEYPLLINWIGFDDVEHIQLIKFPELSFPKDEIPSTTNMTQVKEITAATILDPVAPGLKDLLIIIMAVKHPEMETYDLLNMYDNENIFKGFGPVPTYTRVEINISNNNPDTIVIPKDYIIAVKWKDWEDLEYESLIYLPEIVLNYLDTPVLYFADDWSIYYDQGLTNLANSPIRPGPYKLYIASDFSLYWNKELSALASTPLI